VTGFYSRLEACQQAARFEKIPVVGVCGTVNSGKSTAVAGFLSDAGRDRVLVGELDSEGTHRFVFWLPASWQDNGLGDLLTDMLRKITGTNPEYLSEDSTEAAKQYNAARDRVHEFNVPLIAYDSLLDKTGIAFLDCPDTQRSLDDSVDDFTARLRLERLKTIAPLCSAFVVVASMQQKGTEEVGKVFRALKGSASEAPLYFVLNMTKTDEVSKYLPEATMELDRWNMTGQVSRIYLSPFIHSDDPHAKVTPVITSMDEHRVRLENLGSELDPAELQKRHRVSCMRNLRDLLEKVAGQMRHSFEKEKQHTIAARDRICGFMTDKFIGSDGNPRALEFNEAAKRLGESIQRTAPIPIRIAHAPTNWLRGLTSKWKRRDATDADLEKFAQIKSSDFSGFLLGNKFIPAGVTAKPLDDVWKRAVEAVTLDGKSRFLNERGLDEMTRRMWDEIPFGKKIALFKNVLIAMSAIAFAGMLLPFDGGASLVIVAKAHIVLGGTEILGMLVGGPLIGALMTGASAKKLVERFESECARPQLNILYAALADGLGIPRYLDGPPQLVRGGKVYHEFQVLDIPPFDDRVGVLANPLIRMDEPAWKTMMEKLNLEKR
jgi:hypothetical protein